MTCHDYRYPLTCVRGVLHRPWSSVGFPQWQHGLIIHSWLFHIAFVSFSISLHLIVTAWRLVCRKTSIIIPLVTPINLLLFKRPFFSFRKQFLHFDVFYIRVIKILFFNVFINFQWGFRFSYWSIRQCVPIILLWDFSSSCISLVS